MAGRPDKTGLGRAVLSPAAGAVASAVLLSLITAAPQQPPDRCEVRGSLGQCLVGAIDPGHSGAPSPPEQPRRRTPTGPAQTGPPPPPRLGPGGPIPGALGQVRIPNIPAPPNPPAPAADPAIVAQRAIELLGLRGPTIHTSATDTTFVGVPLWLWTDQGAAATGPISATATAGTASVTATGRLTAIEWTPGPPGAQLRCAGPGAPWNGQPGPSPDCGYTYQQRSLPERTHGTGRWPITATGVWQVTWTGTSAGVPVTGAETLRIPTATSLAVGEIQVLVTGS